MDLRNPGRKIDQQAESGKDVAADEDVVRPGERRKASNIKINIHPRHEQPNREETGGYWFPSGFMDYPGVDWVEAEPLRQPGADTAAGGTGINLRHRLESGFGGANRPNADGDTGAVIDEVLDRLLKPDLGPERFFGIYHRGTFGG